MKSKKLKSFIEKITKVNRNPNDDSVLNLLKDISTNPEWIIETDKILYRSRIFKETKKKKIIPPFYGYKEKDSFIPPIECTRDMRANYRYIPYLYCTDNPYLSLLEVRPRFGATVSVAEIGLSDKITLLDFTTKTKPPKMNSTKQNLFSDLSELFSKPVTDDNNIIDYIPTQYIAEYVKNLGYDGISYKSSVFNEYNSTYISADYCNVVIFNYNKCSVKCSNVYKITSTILECRQIDDDINKKDISDPINTALNKTLRGI